MKENVRLESIDIMNLLSKYCGLFPSSLIETCIINLPENMQLVAIDKYYKYIDKDGVLYLNFYYSVSDKARLKLKAYFPNAIKDDILLELEDLNESELRDKLFLECDRLLKKYPALKKLKVQSNSAHNIFVETLAQSGLLGLFTFCVFLFFTFWSFKKYSLKEKNIKNAICKIECLIGPVLSVSSFFYSKPWGFESENDFVNAVIAVKTEILPLQLLKICKQMQKHYHR